MNVVRETRCAACPIPSGLRCYQEQILCDRAAMPAEDAFRAMLVRHAEVRAVKPPIPVAESIALLDRMKKCPSRTPEAECGCGGMARCAVGMGSAGLVNHQDCFACLSASESTAPRAAPTAPGRTAG